MKQAERHLCFEEDFDIFGCKPNQCEEDESGRFWVKVEEEYYMDALFCPFCGKESPDHSRTKK